MSIPAFFLEAQLTLPFELKGQAGTIAVYYGPDDDPAKAGFNSLPGLSIPLDVCLGYPVMHARIESYAGTGYRMSCGWIQLITRKGLPSLDQDWDTAEPSVSVDLYPSMEDLGSPFCAFGPLAPVFDAPCRNLWDEQQALTWVADTFLVTVPGRSRDEEIERLASFRWGYREYAVELNKPVELLPVESTPPGAWNSHLAYLRDTFDQWHFKEA